MEPRKPLEILFGDPDLAGTRPLRVELRRRGARVRLVTGSAEVRGQVLASRPDLLVLDERLVQDGPSNLVSHVQESFPDLKLILLRDEAGAVSPGSEAGLLFSAGKPVSRETFLGVIDEAFPGRLDGQEPPRRESHTLLCVDDDPAYLGSLSRFLRRRGYEVSSHGSARRALEALPDLKPELAIVDIMMPGMDGLELTRRIHKDSKGKVPVVVLTALCSDETYHRARESGASYCLTKPCRPEDFLNVVDFIAGDLDEEERRLLEKRL